MRPLKWGALVLLAGTMTKWMRCAAAVALGVALLGAGEAQAQKLPLVTFHNPSVGDYFTTSNPAWTCIYFHTCTNSPGGYVAVGLQGHVFSPSAPQPAGTVKLFHWFSSERGDNFLTTDPAWSGVVGAERDGYFLYRIEGFIATSGLMPLTSFWNASVGDNAALVAFPGGIVPAGYTSYRVEGSLLPPDGTLTCSGSPTFTDPSPWVARANYVGDRWPQQADFLHGDRVKFTAPADWYQYDYWGHTFPVRGYYWDVAPSGFPAPGIARLALLARVTTGRVFVNNRWIEANRWFRALGEQGDWDGPCIFYDATGSAPGELETMFNDDNVGDNSGGAHITMKQWF